MAKDRFRDWGLYHKSVATLVAALVLSVLVRALMAIDAAYAVKDEIMIDANAAEIWPWILDNNKRADWQGEIMRVSGVSSEAGSSRLVFWKRHYQRWRSYEVTTALVKERLIRSEHNSDEDKRWWQIELVPQSPCGTKVIFTETIQPNTYENRFWFFRVRDERQKRVENSVKSLKGWVEKTASSCAESKEAQEISRIKEQR